LHPSLCVYGSQEQVGGYVGFFVFRFNLFKIWGICETLGLMAVGESQQFSD